MKEIPLGGKAGQGKVALVDDDVFDWASRISWHFTDGYAVHAQSTGNGHTPLRFKLHHLVVGRKPGKEVDHINGNRLDNRRENLRFVTKTQNMWNRKVWKWHPGLTLKGISKRRHKYYARIQAKGIRSADIGGFKTERAAAIAYDLWAVDLFGPYARTNFSVAAHTKRRPAA